MNINDFRPAREFAKLYGCKSIVYGPPGRGKTPILNTAPNPMLLVCEPGMLSMRQSTIPTWEAFTADRIDEFFKWFFNSNERRKFDTLGIDSVSQVCDVYLQNALKNNRHGLAAYGEMARNVMNHLRLLFYTQYIHTYLIAKEETTNGLRRPYFPGKQLPIEISHMYDFILHLDIYPVPQMGQYLSFRCNSDINTVARNRTGNLNDYEPPNFSALVTKAMST